MTTCHHSSVFEPFDRKLDEQDQNAKEKANLIGSAFHTIAIRLPHTRWTAILTDVVDYEIVIGLEVHAQLLTKSKMYCSCSADYANAPPNTHVCPICLGMPGVLPTINQMAHKGLGCQSDFRLSGKLYERPQFV